MKKSNENLNNDIIIKEMDEDPIDIKVEIEKKPEVEKPKKKETSKTKIVDKKILDDIEELFNDNKKMSKAHLILILLVIICIIGFGIYIIFNYDISINIGGSREYKRLLEWTNIDYYKNNHIMVMSDNEYELSLGENNVSNGEILSHIYSKTDDGKYIRLTECNNGDGYFWIAYLDNNYFIKYIGMDTYMNVCDVNNNSKYIGYTFMPDINIYKNYNPIFVKSNTLIENNDGGHEEIYKMILRDDDTYRKKLYKFLPEKFLDKTIYLRIYIDKMNLVRSVAITDSEFGKYIAGPFEYSYYQDIGYDFEGFLDFINDRKDKKKCEVSIKGLVNKENFGNMDVREGEYLFIEANEGENVYKSDGSFYNYKEDVINDDTVLYIR